MDGLLVIDKPAGPTSHDVVARMRRVLQERGIGHTGTLDPMATGVLPLVVGRATRLARFMSAGDKSYEAVVALGQRTDTADAQGVPLGAPYAGPLPARDAIDAALDAFRGTFLQQPPAFSAKRIAGKRSHKLARAARQADTGPDLRDPRDPRDPRGLGDPPRLPDPVSVTASAIEVIAVDGDKVTLRVDCSAGFYVRSLAHDLGERLGTGAHLAALRRTHSGEFSLADAIPLRDAEQDPAAARDRVIPLARLLTRLASVVLTHEGVRRAVNGRDLGPGEAVDPSGFGRWDSASAYVRLLNQAGELVGIAEPTAPSGLLHPSVVLM